MEFLFQSPRRDELTSCPAGTLCLWPLDGPGAERRALALHVMEHGIADFARGAGPVTRIILQEVPTLDDMLAATLAAQLLAEAPLPPGAAAFARYAAVVRDGLRPNAEIPPERSLEAIYLAIRCNAGNDLAEPAVAKRFVQDWARLERRILESAEAGIDPFKAPLFVDGSEFGRELAFLRRDLDVFAQDVLRGEQWSVAIPEDGVSTTSLPRVHGLLLRNPRSLLFKIWSRNIKTANLPDGEEYMFLAARTNEKVQWVFSTDRVYRISLKGLAEHLQAAEARKDSARAAKQQWFDGEPFDHTLVAAPSEGTILSDEEVLDVVKRWTDARPLETGEGREVRSKGPEVQGSGNGAEPNPGKSRIDVLGVWGRRAATLIGAGLLVAGIWFGWLRPRPTQDDEKRGPTGGEKGLQFWPVSAARWVSDDAISVIEPQKPFQTLLTLTSPSRRGTHAQLNVTIEGDGLPKQADPGELQVTVNRGRTQTAKLGRKDPSHFCSDAIDVDLQASFKQNVVEIYYDHPTLERDAKVHVGLEYSCDRSELPALHVLAVGVSKYEAKDYRLMYARGDAEAICKLFERQQQPLFKTVKVTLMPEKAKREDIVTSLGRLGREVGEGDLVLVTFAGHGAVEDGVFYFLPYNFSDDSEKPLSASAVSHDDIMNPLHALVTNRHCQVLLVLDACASGAAAAGLTRGQASEAAAEEAAKLWSVPNPEGITLTAACLPSAKAIENGEWHHGALSLALIEVLTNRRELQSDCELRPKASKLVTWQFVDNYLHNRVIELTGGKQFVSTHAEGGRSLDLIPIVVNESFDKPAAQ
jgi:hypothetical protein